MNIELPINEKSKTPEEDSQFNGEIYVSRGTI